MKLTIWIIVVIMLWICSMLAQHHRQSSEVGVAVSSGEEVAGIVLLTFLSADEDDEEEQAIAESYLQTQLGFDPTSEQDERDKAKIRAAVKKYVSNDDEQSPGMKQLNAELEKHIPNDREREVHRFNIVQKIGKLQRESAVVFKGTKAYWKLKQIENTVIEKEQ